MGYWVTLLARTIEADFEERLAPYGVTRASWAVLSAIAHHDKTTPAELAAFVGVDGAAITRQLDRLSKQGLISRRRGTSDRRSVTVKISAKGADIIPKIAADSIATNEKFLSGISKSEVEAMQRVIEKMLSNGSVTPSGL